MFGNFLYYDSLPRRVSVPSPFVSLFIFYILSYLLSKMMGCFSGCLMSSASDQKLFCEVCSVFKCSFNEFVGEKVVSPSYSSAILAPPPFIHSGYKSFIRCQFSSVQFCRSVVWNSLRSHESQHARPPCPSPTPRVYSNSCP